jgi:hypothetical protein
MKYSPNQRAHQGGQPEGLQLVAGSLPQWEQLPPRYQRELVLVLTTLLVRQLPVLTNRAKEPPHEHK